LEKGFTDVDSDDESDECMVCNGVPKREWRLFGTIQYQKTYFHCESHAEEFHTEIKHKFICCAPPYVPHNVYPWQEQGRAIAAAKKGALSREANQLVNTSRLPSNNPSAK